MDIFSLGKVVKTIILRHLQKHAHGHLFLSGPNL